MVGIIKNVFHKIKMYRQYGVFSLTQLPIQCENGCVLCDSNMVYIKEVLYNRNGIVECVECNARFVKKCSTVSIKIERRFIAIERYEQDTNYLG